MTNAAREILAQRARALARPVASPPTQTIQLVTFALAGETYGIDARLVLEIQRPTELWRLPGAEPPLFGITTWRGALLNILDLRPMLGVVAGALDDLSRLMVLGDEKRLPFGILAERVHGIDCVALSSVRDPPDGIAVRRQYVHGVTGDAVIVLAAAKLLAASA